MKFDSRKTFNTENSYNFSNNMQKKENLCENEDEVTHNYSIYSLTQCKLIFVELQFNIFSVALLKKYFLKIGDLHI